MDPGTIAGVTIGAVSLSIQLLDGIFKGTLGPRRPIPRIRLANKV